MWSIPQREKRIVCIRFRQPRTEVRYGSSSGTARGESGAEEGGSESTLEHGEPPVEELVPPDGGWGWLIVLACGIMQVGKSTCRNFLYFGDALCKHKSIYPSIYFSSFFSFLFTYQNMRKKLRNCISIFNLRIPAIVRATDALHVFRPRVCPPRVGRIHELPGGAHPRPLVWPLMSHRWVHASCSKYTVERIYTKTLYWLCKYTHKKGKKNLLLCWQYFQLFFTLTKSCFNFIPLFKEKIFIGPLERLLY